LEVKIAMERQSPYDDFVMDHIRNARNFRTLSDADRDSTGFNPLCGDRVTLQLRVADGRIADAAYQCECCGVSMASASMMTEWVKGRAPAEAGRFARDLVASVTGRGAASAEPGEIERALLATVRDFPSRAGCAVLPWTTLEALLAEVEAGK
jgi:nitrogen fixation protein NifU and related proteins